MKRIFELVVAAALCIGSAGVAIGAPAFDIDFYGADTGLVRGEYDTNTDLTISDGQSFSVDILASGFEAGNGLMGWSLRLDYGGGLTASNLAANDSLWPLAIRQPVIEDGYLTIEGGAPFNTGVEGDNLLLFSFDLTGTDSTMPSVLTLWDFDKGGPAIDTITLGGDNLDGNFPVNLGTANANTPIPPAAWLFGSGLMGLWAFRRKGSLK